MGEHKKDASIRVPQRDKIKESFEIKDNFILTDNQKKIIEASLDKDVKMVIINSNSGTGKTYCAILAALLLLNKKKISDIVYIRSLIQAKDGETGFLAGDLSEKMFYYSIPIYDKLEELLNKNDINKLLKEQRIKIYPTSMLRGYSFNTTGIVLDEAQNFLFDSIYTVATRTGMFSKLFILGDSEFQNDLGIKSGFKKFIDIFSDEESYNNGIRYFKLDTIDIVRSPLVKFIVEKIKKHNIK